MHMEMGVYVGKPTEKVLKVEPTPELQELAREVLDIMPHELRMRLTHMDPTKLSLRQTQQLGAAFIQAMQSHPAMRARIAQWAWENPGDFAKLAASERPKEVHIEQDIRQSVVVVPGTVSSADWLKQVKDIEGEVIE